MPASNVRVPFPLTRLNPWFPGQMGVPGGWTETGLRTHPTGAVFYVDPNYPGASDGRDGTEPTDPLLTVGTALTKCQAHRGDIIKIGANDGWTYASGADYATAISEAVEVTVPGVRIVGAAPSSSIGVVWSPPTAGATCITVSALDVLIEGIAFMGGVGGDAIYAEWDGATLYGDNLTVRHCLFDEDIDTAIQLEESWFADIHNNLFQECDVAGIVSVTSGTWYSQIHRNYFIDLPLAISLLGGSDYNEIFENRLYNSDAENGAAAPNAFIDTTGGDRNSVHHNTMSSLLGAGNGAYDDTCSAAGTDAWIHNYLLNGPTVLPPA